MDSWRFAIIAGSNKCATTSLYRYLSDHPAVCPSRRKELLFFSPPPNTDAESARENYYRQFFVDKPMAATLLEASPQYLHGGLQRAQAIRAVLPEARLIFILRDPVRRLESYYRSDHGQRSRPSYGFTFKQVVDEGLAGLRETTVDRTPRDVFAQEIRMAQYVHYLKEYAQIWPLEQMKILFQEELERDPLMQLQEVARYLDIDASFYDDYSFEKENRTRRGHRFAGLQALALRINQALEPLLIRNRRLKGMLRRIYNGLNEASAEVPIEIEPDAVQNLRDYYRNSVCELAAWMEECFPQQRLPAWVKGEASTEPLRVSK